MIRGGGATEIVVELEASLVNPTRGDAAPTAESRRLADELNSIGVALIPVFPAVDMIDAEMLAQFSALVPDDEADQLLATVRELSGVENAYKKPGALPA